MRMSYKRIIDRVPDDPVLCGVDIPLANINAKSSTAFFSRQDKRSRDLEDEGIEDEDELQTDC